MPAGNMRQYVAALISASCCAYPSGVLHKFPVRIPAKSMPLAIAVCPLASGIDVAIFTLGCVGGELGYARLCPLEPRCIPSNVKTLT